MKNLQDFISKRKPESPSLSDFPREVGGRLRRQRIAFAWRQADLAERAGVSVQTIKAVEKGEPVSYESLFRLLLTLGHGVDFLRMLEAPHFPNLLAQERYSDLMPSRPLEMKRVRAKAEGAK